MHLGNLLHATSRRHPQKTAVICRDESVSYEELDRAARGLARWFLSQGLRPGDRVAIHSANSVDAVRLLLACFHAGLIAVPVNLRMKAAEVAYILGHSKSAMCFSQPELGPVAATACAEGALKIVLHTRLPEVEDAGELPEFDEDQLALILYTSGTTARPKGVVHSHASLLASARTVWPTGVGEDAILMVPVPLMHASGLSCTTLPALLKGATTVMTPMFEACEVLDAIERHRCTWGLGLPAMMQFMTVEQERRPRDVSSLRDWLAGGDAVPLSLQERFQRIFGLPLLEGYAMSESVIIACNSPQAHRAGALGRPCEGVELRVVDFSGNLLPHGQLGELEVRSPGNFVGYWQDAAATEATLHKGWLLTGDLVRRDAEGYVWFEGRRKELIIRGGSNISPQEVEEALYRHPAVMEAGVIGMPDPVYNEQVVACVSLREGCTADAAELIDFARTLLADYKLPARIVFLPVLPKGITGKVQRRALKELAAEAPPPATLPIDRRAFLAAPFFIRNLISDPPGGQVRLASFGAGGMAFVTLDVLARHPKIKVACVAEVDSAKLDQLKAKYPDARVYQDWRAMLARERKNIDAVCVGTPDHMHAPMAMSAMRLGLPVYQQKPMAHSIYEVRQLTAFARRKNLITQMGIQIHSAKEYRGAVQLIQGGVIGKVTEVHSWSEKKWGDPDPLPGAADPVPATLNWDHWIGVAQPRPFIADAFHPVNWRKRIDFGTATFGDMGCHILDPVFSALALPAPISVRSEGPAPNRQSWALDSVIRYVFPATKFTAGPSLPLTWYDGDARPAPDVQALVGDRKFPGQGSLFLGTNGMMLLPHIGMPILLPENQFRDFEMPNLEVVSHYNQFVDAVLGDGKTTAGFDYAGPLTEAVLLGPLATRFPKTTLAWNSPKLKFTNSPEANQYIQTSYRNGWKVKGL